MKAAPILALLAFAAASCSKSDSDSSKPAASIVGTWRPVEIVTVSTPQAGGPSRTTRISNFGQTSVVANADGTGAFPGAGVPPHTYTFNAPVLKYQGIGSAQGQVISFTKTVTKLTADSLVWQDEPEVLSGNRVARTWRFVR